MPRPRGKGDKQVKPLLNILCEGDTEELYIEAYKKQYYSSVRNIKIHSVKENTAASLVNKAINLKQSPDATINDSWWVVYDRENPDEYRDQLHQKALDKATNNNIKVALSNVCIEVWLLLHFIDSTAPYTSCINLLKTSTLKNELNKLDIQDYKTNGQLFAKIIQANPHAVNEARERAIRMNQQTQASSGQSNCPPYKLNPYTDMHLLLDAIDDMATG